LQKHQSILEVIRQQVLFCHSTYLLRIQLITQSPFSLEKTIIC
jgi:hypothetical protein